MVIPNQPANGSSTYVSAPTDALALSRSALIIAEQVCFCLILALEVTDASLPPSVTHTHSHTQVEPVSSSLNTNDVFLLKSPQSCFLWKGKGMTDEEVAAAKVVSQLMGGVTKEVEETSEPGEPLRRGKKKKKTSTE